MKKLIVIAGPTASGKTSLSISLAKALGGEIVSADSMQIYRSMNIGTAKPTPDEMQGIPHHMIDIIDPSQGFSAAEYCALAHPVIEDISLRGKIPIMVGGTGLYIDSVVNNVDFNEAEGDPAIRRELEDMAKRSGAEAVHALLREIDPETAEKYHPNNLRRIIRAIEFYRTCGTTISQHAKIEKIPRYDTAYFCIDWEREILYERINRRVDIMLDAGLEIEVKSLIDKGYTKELTSMQGIGYKEFYPYFDGEASLFETAELIKMNSRRYAKRQLTWFRRNKEINWLPPDTAFDDSLSILKERQLIK